MGARLTSAGPSAYQDISGPSAGAAGAGSYLICSDLTPSAAFTEASALARLTMPAFFASRCVASSCPQHLVDDVSADALMRPTLTE